MGSHGHHIVMPRTYVMNLLTLMALMILTIVAAKLPALHFGDPWNLLIAMLIAFAKVYFIVTIFMHLKFSSKLTFIFAITGFVWVLILFVLTWADYFTRWWITPFIDGKMGG